MIGENSRLNLLKTKTWPTNTIIKTMIWKHFQLMGSESELMFSTAAAAATTANLYTLAHTFHEQQSNGSRGFTIHLLTLFPNKIWPLAGVPATAAAGQRWAVML